MVLINVLTRTSARPHFFNHNHESLKSQTHKDWRHIISYDDDETKKYLDKYEHSEKFQVYPVKRIPRNSPAHFPYNLYCNELNKKVTEGWIMYLDDDDIFYDNGALERASQFVEDHSGAENSIIIWKVKFPKVIKPSINKFGKKITRAGFPSQGFMFHSRHIGIADWDDRKGADSRVVHTIYKMLKHVHWLDDIITQIGYKQGFGGHGDRKDIPLSGIKPTSSYFKNKTKNKIIMFKKKELPTKKSNTESTITFKKKTISNKQTPIDNIETSLPNQDQTGELELNDYSSNISLLSIGDDQLNIDGLYEQPDQTQIVDLSVYQTHAKAKAKAKAQAQAKAKAQTSAKECDNFVSAPVRSGIPDNNVQSMLEPDTNTGLDEEYLALNPRLEKLLELLDNNERVYIMTGQQMQFIVNLLCQTGINLDKANSVINQLSQQKQLQLAPPLYQSHEPEPEPEPDPDPEPEPEPEHKTSITKNSTDELPSCEHGSVRKDKKSGKKHQRPKKEKHEDLAELIKKYDETSGDFEASGDQTSLTHTLTGVDSTIDKNSISIYDAAFILNLHGTGETLSKKLESYGIETVVIKPDLPRRTNEFHKPLLYLKQVLESAIEEEYERILILTDDVYPHKNIKEELLEFQDNLVELDWNIIFLSIMKKVNLRRPTPFDWNYYVTAYLDISNAGIDNEKDATRHWKKAGFKDGRVGCREILSTPDINSSSAYILHSNLFPKLSKQLKIALNTNREINILNSLTSNDNYTIKPNLFVKKLTSRRPKAEYCKYQWHQDSYDFS